MEKLLQIEDVAELTGYSVNTLYFWRARGEGPKAAKIGRRLRYREWVEAQFAAAAAGD